MSVWLHIVLPSFLEVLFLSVALLLCLQGAEEQNLSRVLAAVGF